MGCVRKSTRRVEFFRKSASDRLGKVFVGHLIANVFPKNRLQLPQLRPYIVGYGWWDEEAHLCEQFVEGFYLETDQPGLDLLSRKSGTLTTTPQTTLSDDSDKYISVYLVLSLLLIVLCFPHRIAFFCPSLFVLKVRMSPLFIKGNLT